MNFRKGEAFMARFNSEQPSSGAILYTLESDNEPLVLIPATSIANPIASLHGYCKNTMILH